jgi:uncharacterized repeat protein (TIGR03847 family)
MPRRLFIFNEPDRFVTGTVGDPGARTFFLQARKGGALVSVVVEKAQVAALAVRLSELLAAVVGDQVEPPRRATAAGATDDASLDDPLDEPLVEAFRVGAMALAWDPAAEQVVIEAQPDDLGGEYLDVPDDAEDGPDMVRVRIEPAQAHQFIRGAERLIAAGRPPCPFCGEPLEPTGHFCVRSSGALN